MELLISFRGRNKANKKVKLVASVSLSRNSGCFQSSEDWLCRMKALATEQEVINENWGFYSSSNFFFQFTYTVHQTKWCKLFFIVVYATFSRRTRDPCTQSTTADVRRERWRPARLMLNFHVFCHTHFSSLNATNFVCAAAGRTLSKYRISRRASSSTAHERWWLCFVQPAKSHRTELKCERV